MSRLYFQDFALDPVEVWGVSGLRAAIDDGGIREWQRLTLAEEIAAGLPSGAAGVRDRNG